MFAQAIMLLPCIQDVTSSKLSWGIHQPEVSHAFLSPSTQIERQYLKLGDNHFLTDPSQLLSNHLMAQSVLLTELLNDVLIYATKRKRFL
jgi:hypothetical protein